MLKSKLLLGLLTASTILSPAAFAESEAFIHNQFESSTLEVHYQTCEFQDKVPVCIMGQSPLRISPGDYGQVHFRSNRFLRVVSVNAQSGDKKIITQHFIWPECSSAVNPSVPYFILKRNNQDHEHPIECHVNQ